MNTKAFTLVEVMVVVIILTILSGVGFMSFSGYLSTARDTERKADLVELQSALVHTKQISGVLPVPKDSKGINYGTTKVAEQGTIDSSVNVIRIKKIPTDPKINKGYNYSKYVLGDADEFQLAATLENDGTPIALLVGNYNPVSKTKLPTIMVATNNSINVSTDSNKFIFDGLLENLPYTFTGGNEPKADEIEINTGINSNNFYQSVQFRTCDEIKAAGKHIPGITDYEIINNTGNVAAITGCTNP